MERLVKDRTTEELLEDVLGSFMRLMSCPRSAAEETLEVVRVAYNEVALRALLLTIVATAEQADMTPGCVLAFFDLARRLMTCHNGCTVIETMARLAIQRQVRAATVAAAAMQGTAGQQGS